MIPARRFASPLTAVVVLLAACQPTETDLADVPTWALSEEPTLVLGDDGAGGVSPGPAHEFHLVVGAFELPDGDLAVVNGVPAEVRRYSPTGEFRGLIGREGDGPGEFRDLFWAALLDDTLALWDRRLRRGTLLPADGQGATSIHLRPDHPPQGVAGVGVLPDRRWVVATNPTRSPRAQPGLYQDTIRLGVVAAGGSGALLEVGPMLTAPLVVADVGDDRLSVTGSRFGVGTVTLVLGNRLVLADGESGQIRIIDGAGQLETEFLAPVPRVPLTGAMLNALLDEALASLPDTMRWPLARARHDRRVTPDLLPAFRRILGDGSRHLWLEAYPLREGTPATYHIVRDDGTLVARLDAPPGFEVLSVGESAVLGIHRDADGVQRVMRYGLTRR